jgi:hypothetical protein
MPHKNPADKLECQRQYQKKNREKINAKNRARYADDPTAQKLATKAWREKNRERYNETARLWIKANRTRLYDPATPEGAARLDKENKRKKEIRDARKIEVLSHYGNGKLCCVWPDCEVSDVDMLTIDHVNNNGAEHRRELGTKGKANHLYRILKSSGYPEGYQTLCANHQLKKELVRKRNINLTER